jgi:acetyl-CoA C-acetyltransferase
VKHRVAIISVGNTEYTSLRREIRSKAELAFAAIKEALDEVRICMEDIDACVFTSVDGFEGNVRPARVLESFGQAHNVPLIDVNTGGSAGGSGVKEAVHLISAGIYELVLVYGSPTFNEVVDNQQVLNTASPPIFEKPFGLGAAHMGSLYGARYMREYNFTARDLAQVAAKNHKAAVSNPFAHIRAGYTTEEVLNSPMVAWPLHLYEICPVSSGAVAMIFASEGKAKELSDTPVWIEAMSSIADTFLSGYKDYKDFANLKILAQRIYEEVGIRNPREELDVIEIFNPFAPFELLAYEALGLCGEGQGVNLMKEGATEIDGDIPCNPSGGVLCTNSGISASVTRHAEVALQLMGKAEGRQVKSPERGLAHSWGGNDGQFHTVAILSR